MIESGDINRIFKLLGNHRKRKIIKELWENRVCSLKVLSENLNTSVQEVHRILTELNRTGVVNKNKRGEYTLTSLGAIISLLLDKVENSVRLRGYLLTHMFPELPKSLIYLLLEIIYEAEVLTDTYLVYEKLINIIHNSTKELYLMSRNLAKIINESNLTPKNEFCAKIIILCQTPSNTVRISSKISNFSNIKNMKIKYICGDLTGLPELIINEQEAIVMLANQTGNPDFNRALLFHSVLSVTTIKLIFDYYWEISENLLLNRGNLSN